jgi:hypothetical protein
VRYIPLPQAPRNRGFTILLALLWVVLLIYIVTHPDPFGFIVIGVFTLFILPLFILTFRLPQVPDDDEALAAGDEGEAPHSKNGHVQP